MAEPFMRLAVIGDPVDHSRSPELHHAFLTDTNLPGSYERITVRAGEGARSIDALRAQGYLGLNVTTPLKEEAFARADSHDEMALATGSVNTLLFSRTIAGYNTDGAGTLGVLSDAGLRGFAGARVLVLGAGPTARSAIVALRLAGAHVWLWNRTGDRAKAIARVFAARTFAGDTAFDAVFSALPPDVTPNDTALVQSLHDTPIFVDANYGARATLAAALGRGGVDGTRMLEHSARASFDLWRASLADILSESV
jgi:shikimate dehydrogenase